MTVREQLQNELIKQNIKINRLYKHLCNAKTQDAENQLIYKIYDATTKYDKIERELATEIFK